MITVIMAAFAGLIISMTLEMLGLSDIWITIALAVLASIPFALYLKREREAYEKET